MASYKVSKLKTNYKIKDLIKILIKKGTLFNDMPPAWQKSPAFDKLFFENKIRVKSLNERANTTKKRQ